MKPLIKELDKTQDVFKVLKCIIRLKLKDGIMQGYIIDCNDFACDFIGYTPQEIKAMGIHFLFSILHLDDFQKFAQAVTVLHSKLASEYRNEYRLLPKNSKYYHWVQCTCVNFVPKDADEYMYFANTMIVSHKPAEPYIYSNTVKQITAGRKGRLVELKKLSEQEIKIARYIVANYTDKEIARLLNLSPKTVKTHRHNIHQKLQTCDTADLVRLALQHAPELLQ